MNEETQEEELKSTFFTFGKSEEGDLVFAIHFVFSLSYAMKLAKQLFSTAKVIEAESTSIVVADGRLANQLKTHK